MRKDKYQVELTIKYKQVPDSKRAEYVEAIRWLFDQFDQIMAEKEKKGNGRESGG